MLYQLSYLGADVAEADSASATPTHQDSTIARRPIERQPRGACRGIPSALHNQQWYIGGGGCPLPRSHKQQWYIGGGDPRLPLVHNQQW